MSSDTASALYRDAIEAVDAECPSAASAMRAALKGKKVRIEIAQESLDIDFDGLGALEPAVHVRTRARTVRDLLLGQERVLDAVLADRLILFGSPTSLCDCSEALLLFLKGVVRCSSAETLLLRLERLSRDEEPHDA